MPTPVAGKKVDDDGGGRLLCRFETSYVEQNHTTNDVGLGRE
jgi:hypothetical protein